MSPSSHSRNLRGRVLATVATVAVVTGGALGYRQITSGGSPPAGTANMWVQSGGGTCSRSATPRDLASSGSSPDSICGSFDQANDVCANNDAVLVAAGNYAYQLLSGSNSRSTFCNFTAASGQTVHVAAMDVPSGANWMTFKDMADVSGETINGSLTCSDQSICIVGDNITLDNFDITGPYAQLSIDGCNNCIFKNSDFGTSGNTTSIHCPASGAPQPQGAPFTVANDNNLLITKNNFWQFFGEDPQCGTHLETIRFWDSSDGVTVSSNYFVPGSGDDTSRLSSSQTDNFTDNTNFYILNNYFGELQSGHAAPDMIFGDNHACNHFVFAYNFLANGLGDYCQSETNMWAIGNTGTNAGGCEFGGSGAVNTGNLWSANSHGSCAGNSWVGGTCTNYVCDYSAYNLNADGYHLTASSPAINAGENTYCTSLLSNLDIDAHQRSGVCDAGPDEYGN